MLPFVVAKQELELQVKSQGLAISDYNSCNNNNNNNTSNTYTSQLVNSFLNKSSPTRHPPPPLLDLVGKVNYWMLCAHACPPSNRWNNTLVLSSNHLFRLHIDARRCIRSSDPESQPNGRSDREYTLTHSSAKNIDNMS